MHRCLPLFSALAAAGSVLGLACSGPAEDLGPAGTVGTAPTTAAAPPAADPSVIPETVDAIDEAYVQSVVDALFAVDARATEIFVETRRLDDRALEYLEAIYVGEELQEQIDVWFKTLARGSDTLLPGALIHDVTEMVTVKSDCVFLSVRRSYSDTTRREAAPRTVYLGLAPKQDGDDPNKLNPTAWVLFGDGFNVDGSQPEDPCAGV